MLANGGPFVALADGGTSDPGAIGIHVCALTSTGAAYCWGCNDLGQIGDGTNTDHGVPTAVVGPGGGPALPFASLSTAIGHTCGRTTGSTIYCWGADNVGQLGNGIPRNDTNTPSLVMLGAPTITGVTLGSSTISIDGSTTYDAALFNPGSTLTNVVLQGYILQGATNRAAGGANVNCSGTLDGILPSGGCTASWHVIVSNSNGGSGTLVPGPATFQLDLIQGTTILDSETASITLQ